jgi:hypothetical protein
VTVRSASRDRELLLGLVIIVECVLGSLVHLDVIGSHTGFVVAECAAVVNASLLAPILLRHWRPSSTVILVVAAPIVIWAISKGGAAQTWIAGLPAVLVLVLIFRIVESRGDGRGRSLRRAADDDAEGQSHSRTHPV